MALRAAVVGVGHLGQHHARIYAQSPDADLVAVCDADEKQGRKIARKFGVEYVADFRELLDRVDLVSIAVPTVYHFDVAAPFLERGIACLVEKPMTATLELAQQMVDVARKAGALLQVGHIERFNPALVAARSLPLDPKFIECDRLGPFSFRSTDIGVVMDLMIHDLDIVLDLARSEVVWVDSAGASVLSEKEDIANARIRFANGCVANLSASRVSTKSLRKIRIFNPDSYVSIDYQAKQAVIFRKGPHFDEAKEHMGEFDLSRVKDLAKFMVGKFFKMEKIKLDDQEPLAKEIESFIRAARAGEPPVVSGEDAMRAIALADRIVKGFDRIEPPCPSPA